MTRFGETLQIAGLLTSMLALVGAGLLIIREFINDGRRAQAKVTRLLSWASLLFFVGWFIFLVGAMMRRP